MSAIDAKIAALEAQVAELRKEKAACTSVLEEEWQDVWKYL